MNETYISDVIHFNYLSEIRPNYFNYRLNENHYLKRGSFSCLEGVKILIDKKTSPRVYISYKVEEVRNISGLKLLDISRSSENICHITVPNINFIKEM